MSTGTFACPVDGTRLAVMERQGIEVDYCPTCRGVWLDRGELDKIIERSAVAAPPPPPAPAAPQPPSGFDPFRPAPPRYDEGYRGGDDRHKYPKKRKSFLEELFD